METIKMKYFFTSDEHLGHSRILGYCNRPFKDVYEMDAEIIRRFNSVVTPDDVTYHLGDFTFRKKSEADNYLNRLNGKHIFIRGNHDYWAEKDNLPYIIEKKFGELHFVLCHYPLVSWPGSGHGSIQLFGHEHGVLRDLEKNQLDVGVDTNVYYPYSLDDVIKKFKI